MNPAEARHAFVTGGASGIGLGIAEALAARGVPVTVADIDAESLADAVAGHGGALRAQQLDVRDRAGWARARAEAEAALGPVDILVNNAGIAPSGKGFADLDPADFDRVLAINLVGVFNGVHTFAAAMRERGRGHIVNTSSMAGLSFVAQGVGDYSVAKFGVIALSEGLRDELAPHGVGVSVLCPGLVTTNLGRNAVKLGARPLSDNLDMPHSDTTARDVGETVMRGIERNLAHIVTHKGQGWRAERRHEAIRAAFAEFEGD